MEKSFTGMGIDCYGTLVKGESVEVITNGGSYLLDNEHFGDWSSLVAYLAKEHGSAVQEVIAC